jgi:hypothetical protein
LADFRISHSTSPSSDIVITGLQDRVERVREACKEMINENWLPRAKKLETLLAFLGVESDEVCWSRRWGKMRSGRVSMIGYMRLKKGEISLLDGNLT